MDRCVGCDDETCAATLGAGMDNDCGDFFGGKNGSLNRAIRDGSVTTAMREKALGNLIRVQMRLGMWDDDSEQPYRRYGTEMVDTSEHRALALEAGDGDGERNAFDVFSAQLYQTNQHAKLRERLSCLSQVLLKNRNGLLPLSRNHVKTLAALGPHCNATEALQSNYHGQAPYIVSPAEGLRKYATILGGRLLDRTVRGLPRESQAQAISTSSISSAHGITINSAGSGAGGWRRRNHPSCRYGWHCQGEGTIDTP